MRSVENHPGFGVLLTRLLNHRRVDVTWLSSASGIPETELRSVVSGGPPLAAQLDRLAPALGFHAADLYVIADVPAPEARIPWDPAAGSGIADLVKITMALPSDHRARVHWLVDQLPQELRDPPSHPLRTYGQREAGFGAVLANLLCGNRNLYSLTAAAKALALLTDGRVYLAASTISGIGRGRVPLTPDLVTGFATTLGISAGDLAAITGVELPEPSWPDDPLAAELAGLLSNCRRLTAAQAEHVCDEAKSMLVAVPDDATGEDWNRVYHQHGRWWGAPRR
ncbi:hypothetical protein [Streptomyces mirabilis]|uniref:hypothetical protein n=1 Tax=Streptomyces mirabilis TaxID=68239 RepID=UPI00331E854C